METTLKPIMNELRIIRREIEGIKENMPDKDMFLTEEERRLLEDSYKKEGLVSSKNLRRKLGI